MKIAVLGTGMVGSAIATKLVALGHEVKMGSRTADNDKAVAWAKGAGPLASQGTFADAASFGELVFVCTLGQAAESALGAAGADNLAGKAVLDVTNPLDFSKGMPPTLFVSNTSSLGEQLQAAFPSAKIVKTLNTMNANLMVDPSSVAGGEHDVFVSGNDAAAKAQAIELLRSFGWKSPIDLGDITTARGTESYLPLWIRLWGALGTASFNVKIAR
jgi:predicted dinucleotide-binding enzyme